MSSERIVGRVFGVMGVEAVFDTFHTTARANDRAIEIDRDAVESSMSPGREGNVAKEFSQLISITLADAFQPTRQSSSRGQLHKTSEALEDRIDRQLAQMRQPSSADQDQADHGQRHPERAIVRIELSIREDFWNPFRPPNQLKEVPDERQSDRGCQSLGRELNRGRTLETGSNKSLSKSH